MRSLRYLLFIVLVASCPATAQVSADTLPAGTVWYLHADLDELRNTRSGQHIYRWLDGEVFVEINEDLGIDLNKEADAITAFADEAMGTVIVIDGAIARSTRDKLLALAALETKVDTLAHAGKTFYYAKGSGSKFSGRHSLDDFDDAAYFSFAVENKLIVTSGRGQMEALLESNGHIAGNQDHPGALFVLTADKSFVQAGVRTSALADGKGGNGWDSNILRNTEQVALLVSDHKGFISVEAQLVSREPMMARSLAGIINGLISLQMLDPDLDANILDLIRNTKIDVNDAVLSINAVLDPRFVVDALED